MRLDYIIRKIHRALEDGTLQDKAKRRLITSVYTPAYILRRYPSLPNEDRSLDLRPGFADHREEAGTIRITEGTAARLIAAYRLAKQDQADAPEALRVRGLWDEWITLNHRTLIEALNGGDPGRLAALLNNFDREDFATGTGTSHQDYLHYRHGFWSATYIRSVWAAYRDKALGIGVDPAGVHHPQAGNPCGIQFNGSFIPVEAWRHIYKAHEMAELLRDRPGATVLEIGGGFGSQAYQTIKAANPASYIIYDLPEVCVVSAAFLITALPDKRVALYGEDAEGADVQIRPHFVIDEVEPDSVDLLFNSSSFSEMDGQTANYYLSVVNRVVRGYFMHINHEVRFTFRNAEGESVNRVASEMVPDAGRFKRIYKRPRVFGRPEDVSYPSTGFLYERLSSAFATGRDLPGLQGGGYEPISEMGRQAGGYGTAGVQRQHVDPV